MNLVKVLVITAILISFSNLSRANSKSKTASVAASSAITGAIVGYALSPSVKPSNSSTGTFTSTNNVLTCEKSEARKPDTKEPYPICYTHFRPYKTPLEYVKWHGFKRIIKFSSQIIGNKEYYVMEVE